MTEQSNVEDADDVRTQRTLALRSASVEDTQRLGEVLGGLVLAGDLVLLEGGLGAGKTAFTQGIGKGLGVADTINSPTFTLLKEYAGRLPLYHFDLYRIEDPEELTLLGFEDYFTGDGVSVVEWADRAEHGSSRTTLEQAWPTSWLRIHFVKVSSDERLLCCTAVGRRGASLLTAFARATTRSNEGRAP